MKINQPGCTNHLALKLDMTKAFDRLEWASLEVVMTKMGFPNAFTLLVMRCVNSVLFQVLLNETPTPSFKPTRGIRQGDSLFPFLFIICAEGLAATIRATTANGQLKGLRFGQSGPQLSHLLFADDSLIFLEATLENGLSFKRILAIYESAAGQKINPSKSSLYFSKGIAAPLQAEISAVMGIPKGDNSGKYLGIPYMTGRSKKVIFSYVRDKI